MIPSPPLGHHGLHTSSSSSPGPSGAARHPPSRRRLAFADETVVEPRLAVPLGLPTGGDPVSLGERKAKRARPDTALRTEPAVGTRSIGWGASATQVSGAHEALPLSPTHGLAPALSQLDWGGVPDGSLDHGELVALRMNETVGLIPVKIAIQDAPLVIALAGVDARGVFSDGFGTCVAVILRDAAGVGLMHTSQVDEALPAIIAQAQEDFRMLTGRFANVTIGYFPDGYRDELRDSVRACGPAGFLADEASRFDASRMPPGLDLEARVDWAIEQILSTHAQEAQALANAAHAAAAGRYPVAAVRMAGSMVAVEVDGTIHGLAA